MARLIAEHAFSKRRHNPYSLSPTEDEMKITQKELKEIVSYDKETGLFVWLRPTGRRAKAGQIAGAKNTLGYIQISINRMKYSAHRLAWLYVKGEFPSLDIDHIDEDKANNRISNLRCVTRSENMQNRKSANSNNASGFLGVSFVPRLNKFSAEIWLNGIKSRLGHYLTPVEAHVAYLAAKKVRHIQCPV